MKKIIIPSNVTITKNGLTSVSPAFVQTKNRDKLFTDSNNEYTLTISPIVNRKILHALLQENTFQTLSISGDFVLNVNNIQSYQIKFDSKNEGFDTILYMYRPSDYINCKSWTINCDNIELLLDAHSITYPETDELRISDNDKLPLQNLTINCSTARVGISNQNIKELVINNTKTNMFTLLLNNLPNLKLLDIHNCNEFDITPYPYFELKSLYDSDAYHRMRPKFSGENYELDPFEENYYCQRDLTLHALNYLNLKKINKDCVIKLSPDTTFYFSSPNIIKNSDIVSALPPNTQPETTREVWYKITLNSLIDISNNSIVEITWNNLQRLLLIKSNEVMLEKTNQDKILINKLLKKELKD